MTTMKPTRVAIAQFRAHLSEYVQRAEAGERILVYELDNPLAELRPVDDEAELEVTSAAHPWSELGDLDFPPLAGGVDAVDLLLEDRGTR